MHNLLAKDKVPEQHIKKNSFTVISHLLIATKMVIAM